MAEVAQDVFVRAYAGLSQYSRQVPLNIGCLASVFGLL